MFLDDLLGKIVVPAGILQPPFFSLEWCVVVTVPMIFVLTNIQARIPIIWFIWHDFRSRTYGWCLWMLFSCDNSPASSTPLTLLVDFTINKGN